MEYSVRIDSSVRLSDMNYLHPPALKDSPVSSLMPFVAKTRLVRSALRPTSSIDCGCSGAQQRNLSNLEDWDRTLIQRALAGEHTEGLAGVFLH